MEKRYAMFISIVVVCVVSLAMFAFVMDTRIPKNPHSFQPNQPASKYSVIHNASADEANISADIFQRDGDNTYIPSTTHSKNTVRQTSSHENNQTKLQRKHSKLNVLFMMTDDMRTQLGCYEGDDYLFKQPEIQTPNLDKLAAKSLLLKNAFVQYSLCGPSRTSMLTSRRPDTLGVHDNTAYWRRTAGNYTTLPQYFKEKGFLSMCVGKIFHQGKASNNNDPLSWAEPCHVPKSSDSLHQSNDRWKAVSEEAIEEVPLIDMLSVKKVKEFLETIARRGPQADIPFFLALGFKKPHAAQVCPQKYFELYSIDNDTRYLTFEEEAWTGISDQSFKIYRKAYYACISYVDSLVGEVLEVLRQTGLDKTTIVSFVSDHGYHFGEHGWMGKSRTFDMASRVPLMVHIPGRTDRGIVSGSIVEAVDIFPSIVEAAGLNPVPECGINANVSLCTEGKSFLSLIKTPNTELKGEAYNQRRGNKHGTVMLYSVRTPRYRFSQWARRNNVDGEMVLQEDDEMELYDHRSDYKEYHNVVYQPEYANVTQLLMAKLLNYIG